MRQNLAVRNLKAKPVRTGILILLTALLSLMICGGTLLVASMRSGLASLEARLGADIMVVPYEAKTKSNLENIVLQGNPGYFYMPVERYEKIASLDGIAQISAQFYLASASSGCCSIPVQIIGFDPETDFTITPWIRRSYAKQLQTGDIVVGNDLNAFVGDTLQFYGVNCHVAAKLDKTGTYYDSAVFTSVETIRQLIASSLEKGMNDFSDIDPQSVVSTVLINVAEGYSTEEVMNDINIHVKKVKAVQTKEMISGISASLKGTSDLIGVLIVVVWGLGVVILLLAFSMSVNERKREFAALRVIGASQRNLASLVMQEAVLSGLAGAVCGTVIAVMGITAFHTAIEEQLGLPFLMPSLGKQMLTSIISIAAVLVAGTAAAAVSAYRISRIDTALILRGEQ
ncbi:MAG: FtsX-like permease family protein [Oscillospiraceae bacterium]|nr:FtsX-like permease family protein [Oscillospiraceae bacterium]